MRLLHTATLKLEEFSGNGIPQYAILSHTWSEKEVTFLDMQWNTAEKMVGYEKVKNACSVTAACGFKFVWLDTCCIDKASSAELSEAINSMYRWYQGAEVCYAYLADVSSDNDHNPSGLTKSNFLKSRWFTRGWTLQELIAPSIVIFLDKKWQMIGTKSSLKEVISDITGIPVSILSGGDLEATTIAQRMSWASKRETTRIEDLAYCLMGIFGIHMPLLYGEGEKAFIRLQEEIMKASDDYSLFAWTSTPRSPLPRENYGGLLATSPAAFYRSGNIVQLRTFNALRTFRTPLTVSNKGIHLTLPFMDTGGRGFGFAILNCTVEGKDNMCIAIRLKDMSLTKEYFERDPSEEHELLNQSDASSPQCPWTKICVKHGRLTQKRKLESRPKSDEEEITKVMRRLRRKATNESEEEEYIESEKEDFRELEEELSEAPPPKKKCKV